ncbi:hypothetical protein OIU84_023907 [Salix udensis]|uniref:Uncharacterized protein n=1 Tax=Salix udensis TaxID=889485 RepID=A0AAD6J7R0_9ROSI|nr:hypothetical protein OIU84_023907 [Salix udensis]
MISSPLKFEALKDGSEDRHSVSEPVNEFENVKDSASSRQLRIQNNIELCQQLRTPTPAEKRIEDPQPSPILPVKEDSTLRISNKENSPLQKNVLVIELEVKRWLGFSRLRPSFFGEISEKVSDLAVARVMG